MEAAGRSNTIDILESSGIRALNKRVMIYDYLVSKKNHPTVETIYRDLLPNAPTLSKTTVYNTLNLFLEKNLVQALNIEGHELRYDADTTSHGHFKCHNCGEVFDFRVNQENYPKLPLEGFTSHQIHYYIVGICAECNAASQN